ncbi:LysM peptidoglycan-binding domain-containing protein [Melissococcus plutonius]|uniref:aggregation-promoting factor n=1 Tax=Melissococcus plutonius TaxID=33970 RepID=UPI003C2B4110
MRSLNTILLGTTLAAGIGLCLGTSNAHADSVYTVQSGDTLSSISQKFNGDSQLIQQIARDNSISNLNMIYKGQQLTIKTTNEIRETQTAPTNTVVELQPVITEEPVVQNQSTASTPVTTNTSSAKEWLAQRESGGSYSAMNGRYIGKYQLDASYLNGDYSTENQERVADNYITQRYGSWEGAQAFWQANGWY